MMDFQEYENAAMRTAKDMGGPLYPRRTDMTHTVATVQVSSATYDEVKELLGRAGYGHTFIATHAGEHIDLTGIGMMRGDERKTPRPQGTEARVCEDIARRQEFGLAKYGTSVEANPLTLRQWLQHAYEEALDQAIYLKRAMEEMDKLPTQAEIDAGPHGGLGNIPSDYQK